MTLFISIAIILFIVGGVYFIYKSSRKFNLTDEQLKRIKQRNEQLDKDEEKEQ
ncbi:DUF2897 family protein [Thalassotalea maritima]|uniref:DUF2897 family protein n=1 Tax=Thalassotalea maritima TaxID=3242416 RepID=UPI0035288CBA